MKQNNVITTFAFQDQEPKDGRHLQTAKVGDVYISRMEIFPNAVVGNSYFTSTNIMMYVEQGEISAKFVNTKTQEAHERMFKPGTVAIHLPAGVAFALKNKETKQQAVVVVFSDKPVQSSEDEKEYIIYQT